MTASSLLKTLIRSTIAAGALAAIAAISASASTGETEQPIAATVASSSLSGSYLAAQLAAKDNDDAAAVAFYERSVALDPENVELKQLLFLALTANGRIDEAVKIGTTLTASGDDAAVNRIVSAVDALKNASWQQVGEILKERRTGELDRLMEELVKAWALFGAGKSEEAVALAKSLAGPDWITVVSNYHAGLLLAASGKDSEAEASFEAATKNEVAAAVLTETFLRAIEAQVRLQIRLGENVKAQATLKRGIELVPNHPPFKTLQSQIGGAALLSPFIATATEGAAEVFYNVGTAIGRQGGAPFAQSYLQIAQFLDPASDAIAIGLAGVFENNDFHSRANEQYQLVGEASPYFRRARLEYALNLNQLKKTDEAKAILKALIEQDPKDLIAYTTLGSVLSQHDEYRQAADVYDTAAAMLSEPQSFHWNLYYRRGVAYERLKEWDKAEPSFRKSIELSPNQADVLNYLGYSWIDMGRNLDEGMQLIRKAVELKPRSGFIVDSLGWAHYRLGQYEDAVTHLERAVELMPSDAVVNDHLGDAYWKVGRKLEAKFQWSHALANKPETEDEARIKTKLESGFVEDSPPKP